MKKAPATEAAKRHHRHQYSTAPAGGFNHLDAIRAAMVNAGIEPVHPDAILSRLGDADGLVIRFCTASKPRSKNGWMIAFHDRGIPVAVIAGDWATGAEMKWVAGNTESMTPRQRREFTRRIAAARLAREHEQTQQWETRATAAARLWHSSQPADPQHPYLKTKGIQPHNARQKGGDLVLLLADFNGKAWSLQTIDKAGRKRLMAGGKKAGNFIVVDGPENPARVLVCEGFATGCTLAEMDPAALVLAAVDCGNLRAVAVGARKRWPNADLVVCGDDDRKTLGNPGATAARAAALEAGARFALPEWPPAAPLHLSDFNDLHNWQRGEA